MRPFARLVLLFCVASCSSRPPPRAPDDPPAMRVQLAVPPNAPGDDQFLEVGLFRVALRDPRLGFGASHETLVQVTLALEPPEARVYRLDPTGLTPVPPAAAAALPPETFERRDDPIVSEAGISDAHARWIASGNGRVVAQGSPGGTDGPGRLELLREPAHGTPSPMAPVLEARAGCAPTPLALAMDPLRVAWLDCTGEPESPLLDRLRVSRLDANEWRTTTAPPDLLAIGASPDGREPVLDARFAGDELVVLVARAGDGAGAVVSVQNDSFRLRATLPELRVGRAGPPVLANEGEDVVAAWHEPSLDGAQVVLRRGMRERWPLVGRGGVDTRLAGALGIAPAVAWTEGEPLVAVAEPAGLFVLRWNGEDWHHWGGRIDDSQAVTDVGLVARGGAPMVAWSKDGRVWAADRTRAGWSKHPQPLAEGARAMRIAGAGRVTAVAWLDPAGAARARTSGRDGAFRPEVAVGSAPADAIDVAAGARRAFVALATRPDGAVRLFRLGADGEAVEDLGAPPAGTGARAVAVAATGAGAAVVGWVGPSGVVLARRDRSDWQPAACAAAASLGAAVDSIDLAPAGGGAVWLAVRQTAPERHVRVVRCAAVRPPSD